MSDTQLSNPSTDELLTALMRSLPESYPEAHAAAAKLNLAFHNSLSQAIEQRLIPFLANQPQETIQEKKELAIHVNSDLRMLGLAVRCPKTGDAAVLVADAADRDDNSGRFRTECREQRRKFRTTVSLKDSQLQIRPDTPFTSRFRPANEAGWDR